AVLHDAAGDGLDRLPCPRRCTDALQDGRSGARRAGRLARHATAPGRATPHGRATAATRGARATHGRTSARRLRQLPARAERPANEEAPQLLTPIDPGEPVLRHARHGTCAVSQPAAEGVDGRAHAPNLAP